MLVVNIPEKITDNPFGSWYVLLSTIRHIHVRLEYALGLEVQSFV